MKATVEKPDASQPELGPGARRLRHMVDQALPGAQLLRVVPLKPDSVSADETAKGGGYGAPLRLDVMHGGEAKSLVLHTATSNPFGHDRRSDRANEVLLAADTFGAIPRHVAVLDVGAYRGSEEFVSLSGTGEFYLLTTHANGHVYADDLRHLTRTGSLTALDIEHERKLLDYLAALHGQPLTAPSSIAYQRSLRDVLGSGEGIFGITDAYPDDVPSAPRARLERIEEQCLAWRFRLRHRAARLRRIHGDFHPFNVLFDEHAELAVLDASRGCVGDAADDVTCMALNYAFFALGHPGAWRDALRSLWYGFWEGYALRTGDAELLDGVAPFLAWRGLVLASPAWYPELRVEDRERLLGFVEHALQAKRFSPAMADEFFDT